MLADILSDIYTLRQKFGIIICVKGGTNSWLEIVPVNKYFETNAPIRCHRYRGNNRDLCEFKIGIQLNIERQKIRSLV